MALVLHHREIALWTLVVILLLCVLGLAAREVRRDVQLTGTWSCSAYTCEEQVNTTSWIAEHCTGQAPNQVCSFVLNSAAQQLPLASLNVTYLGNLCASYRCTQETYVRLANYSLRVNTSTLSGTD